MMRGWIYGKHDKTKYMVMSRDQNAGESHSIKIYNRSFEKMGEIKKNWEQTSQIKSLFRKKLRAD
jgi:hypothetical protein